MTDHLNGTPMSVFDFVGSIQNTFRGKHFYTLVFSRSPSGIRIIPNAPYFPGDYGADGQSSFGAPLTVRGKIRFGKFARLPIRVEHLLQLIRETFPGVGFQLIRIGFLDGELIIGPGNWKVVPQSQGRELTVA